MSFIYVKKGLLPNNFASNYKDEVPMDVWVKIHSMFNTISKPVYKLCY